MAFYNMAYGLSFIPCIAVNLSLQVSYYIFMNRYMCKSNVKLLSFVRVIFTHLALGFAHEEFFIKRHFMKTYRVNVNDLFDQDEQFLFKSMEFKKLIKRM